MADDYHFEFLVHSNGSESIDEDDPFMYAERNLPPFEAFDCTSDTDVLRRVFPTRSAITKLLTEMEKRVREAYGMDMSNYNSEGK